MADMAKDTHLTGVERFFDDNEIIVNKTAANELSQQGEVLGGEMDNFVLELKKVILGIAVATPPVQPIFKGGPK